MRYESTVTSIGWIPSEAIEGMMRAPIDIGVGHYDPPPPDHIDADTVLELIANDAIRFANRLTAWIEVDGGSIVGAGYSGGGMVGSTTASVGRFGVTFPGVAYPVLQQDPEIREGVARFVQTVGGRTGAPLPRRIDRPPYLRISGPTAWSTLTLELTNDGSAAFALSGASPFPRHWVYDADGELALKSATTDWKTWTRVHDHARSPWHGVEHTPTVAGIVSQVERSLSNDVMASDPEIRRVEPGATITVQGEEDDVLFLIVDGVFDVEVDGDRVAELGPGAIVGERAILEGGRRTSTVRARTSALVAVHPVVDVGVETLGHIATMHQRERG
ncbi:MAG: cyclic nucleotide-binding domain-containing protein [Acidimicrobiia bacterium]|nr:cyclic nucleotide-binding domain-containing protein [Acidimicrobiia bacterium]